MVKDWAAKLAKHERWNHETKSMWERARKLIDELPPEKLTECLELEDAEQEMLQKAKARLARAEKQKAAALEELRKSEQAFAEMEAKTTRWKKALKLSRMIRESPARPMDAKTPLLDTTNHAIKRKRLMPMMPPPMTPGGLSVCTPLAARRRSTHQGMPAPPTGGWGTAKTMRTNAWGEGRSPSVRQPEQFDFAGIEQLIGDVQRGPSLMSTRTVDTVD